MGLVPPCMIAAIASGDIAPRKAAAAISAGAGSAIGFVSRWADHWSVDRIVVNPAYMVAGEAAERARHVPAPPRAGRRRGGAVS